MSIFCIGRNYVAHAHELGNEVPTSPVIFMKPAASVLAANKNFTIPSFTNDLHYEGELVLRVRKLVFRVRNIYILSIYFILVLIIKMTHRTF
mgnify:CR=1 FL=1